MPKAAAEMTALDVKRLVHPGEGGNLIVAVGGVAGLALQLLPSGGKTWILRVVIGGKRRAVGLGGYPTVSLAQARERAREARDMIRQGIDPVEDRRARASALITAQKRGLTFAEAVDRVLATKLEGFRNEKHRAQWRSTLDTYALPRLGAMQVAEIGVQDVLAVLNQETDGAPLWTAKNETAARLRGRIEAVLSWATAGGHRTGDNPARLAGNLRELLPAVPKAAHGNNHPALQLDDAARWFAALKKREGMGSRALEFLALVAARSGEVRGARWDEIDLETGIWTIPAARMKAGKEHRVALSRAAVELLDGLPRLAGNALVFPAARGSSLSDMTLSATMRRIHEADVEGGGSGFVDRVSKRPAVPHGLRSTFRDWAAERTRFPREMAEMALAHTVGSEVERAYRRTDMVERRRVMMEAWADHLAGKATVGQVVRLGASR